MLVLEQIESVDREELKQQNHIHKDTKCSEETTIYGHVNQHMKENISNTLHKICDAFELYEKSKLSNDAAIANMAKEFQESIKSAKENKVMFSVPCHIDVFEKEKHSIIDYSILLVRRIANNDANAAEVRESTMVPLLLEMFALVSKGNNVSKEVWKLLPATTQKKHNNYLSHLKKIVCDSIEGGEKKRCYSKKR